MSGQVAVRPSPRTTSRPPPPCSRPTATTSRRGTRGAFLPGDLGYRVSRHVTGRGVATTAVAAMARWALGEAGLHRLQAGTLPHDAASQRVLRTSGSTPIGVAPRYPCTAGRWQDHVPSPLLHEPGMR